VTFENDVERELADRKAERERAEEGIAQLQNELKILVDDATARLIEAAGVLEGADVPRREARLAHKQRQSWQWPQGRARVHGWIFGCGDQPVMLRPDGWLAAVHECSDGKRTLCACTFTRASGPLPYQALTLLEPDDELHGGDSARALAIRTKVAGDQTDLPFNAWLTQQVADLLETSSVVD
jgi:hypothetical protein